MKGVEVNDKKAGCYQCKHRGNVAGSRHSSCQYPGNETDLFAIFNEANKINARKLQIQAHKHGILNGWFMWPIDFDPVWLLNCDGFSSNE